MRWLSNNSQSLVTIAVIGLLTIAAALIPSIARRQSTTANSPISFVPDQLDFGRITQTPTSTATWTIRNNTPVRVEVALAADCGCISLSDTSVAIEGNSTATVRVAIDRIGAMPALDSIRLFSKEITARTQQGTNFWSQTASIMAEFYEPLVIDYDALSQQVLPFASHVFEVGLSGRTNISQIDVGAPPPQIQNASVAWNPKFNGGQLKIHLASATESLPGTYNLPISVQFAAHQATETFFLPVRIGLRNVINAHPALIDLSDTGNSAITCAIIPEFSPGTTLEWAQQSDVPDGVTLKQLALTSGREITFSIEKTQSAGDAVANVVGVPIDFLLRNGNQSLRLTKTISVFLE